MPTSMPCPHDGSCHATTSRGTLACSPRCAIFFAVLTPQWAATGFSLNSALSVKGHLHRFSSGVGVRRQRVGPLGGLRLKRGREGSSAGGTGGPEDPFAYSQMESLKWQLRDAEIRAAAAIRERDAAATRTADLERRLEVLERAVPGLALLTPEEATFVSNVKKLRVSVERGIKLLWQRSITSGSTSSGVATSSSSSSRRGSSAGVLSARTGNNTGGTGSATDDWGVGATSNSSSSSGTGGRDRNVTAITSKSKSSYNSRASQRSKGGISSAYSGRELSNVQLGFVADKTQSSARIVFELMKSGQLWDTVLPAAKSTPMLLSHSVGIYARASELEKYVPNFLPILDKHLGSIEPHLGEIMEQFDKIEPHVGYIVENIDVLGPHTGPLVKHIDELLLFADESEVHSRYFPELLPFVQYFAPRLDELAKQGHLTNIRPHLPQLTVHMRWLAPLVDRVTPYPDVSANADVLVWYWGWALRVPILRSAVVPLIFAIPGVPWFVAWMAARLPKRPVRGACSNVVCLVDYTHQPPSMRAALRYHLRAARGKLVNFVDGTKRLLLAESSNGAWDYVSLTGTSTKDSTYYHSPSPKAVKKNTWGKPNKAEPSLPLVRDAEFVDVSKSPPRSSASSRAPLAPRRPPAVPNAPAKRE